MRMAPRPPMQQPSHRTATATSLTRLKTMAFIQCWSTIPSFVQTGDAVNFTLLCTLQPIKHVNTTKPLT